MRLLYRILVLVMPLVAGYIITFIDLDYVEIGAAVVIIGTLLGVLINVLFWNTKQKKLINTA